MRAGTRTRRVQRMLGCSSLRVPPTSRRLRWAGGRGTRLDDGEVEGAAEEVDERPGGQDERGVGQRRPHQRRLALVCVRVV